MDGFFEYNQEQINDSIANGFRPFPEMSDIFKSYRSEKLFKTFSTRLGNVKEEDYLNILKESDASLATDNIKLVKV